ncbi:MAG: cation:proton antiporter [Actinomycetota bacterium]|nr:cation:proton antiporter [Actinomycetota bacterium]
MDPLYLGYALAGGIAVALAALSSRIRNLPFSEPLVALLLGVVAGPYVLDLMRISDTGRPPLLEDVARVLLAVSLMGVALRYPVRDLRAVLRPVALLVTVGMVLTALLSAGLTLLLLGTPMLLAILVGACITPTDPVLASSVVTGGPAEKHLPARLRQMLSMESGANDGLALPLVLVAIALVTHESVGRAVGDGAYQILGGAIIGVTIGFTAGRAMNVAIRRDDMSKGTRLIFSLVLAITVLGITRLANADGVLSVLAAGMAYNATVNDEDVAPQNTIDEAVNRYLVLPLFLLLGVELPWDQWVDYGWRVVPFAAAVLLVRRLPVLLLLGRPLRLRWRDTMFLGWFGPIGVSALFYLSFSAEEGVADPGLWAAGSLAVAISTVAHGMTAAPGRRLYQRLSAGQASTGDGGERRGSVPS